MNAFGIDTVGLDLPAFFGLARLAFVAVFIAWALSLERARTRWLALAGLVGLIGLGWLASNYPLQRLYGLQYPGDRLRNLSWCMSVAAGNGPLSAGIIGHASLDPVWAGLVALMSLKDPERALAIYPYLSLFAMVALALSLFWHFDRAHTSDVGELGRNEIRNRALVVALFAVLLATPPLDYLGPFRGYWAKMFLLKPNHTLGLVMLPVLVGLLTKLSPARALVAGIGLGVLGWVFVIHWAFLCFCLAIYVGLRRVLAVEVSLRELLLLLAAVAVSMAVVAPWLYQIFVDYPHAVTLSAGSDAAVPTKSDWGDVLPPARSLLFLVTLDQGFGFYLGVVGVFAWLRQKQPVGLAWASLVIGAYLMWGINYLLYLGARAREADEFYHFLVFVLSVAAGWGAYSLWRVARRLAGSLDGLPSLGGRFAGVVFAVALMPMAFPYWWQPFEMDAHFRVALDPVPARVSELAEWVRDETDGRDLLIAGGELAHWLPGLTGRQVLVANASQRGVVEQVLLTGESPELAAVGIAPVDYVVFDPAVAELVELSSGDLNERWQEVHRLGHVRVYRVRSANN